MRPGRQLNGHDVSEQERVGGTAVDPGVDLAVLHVAVIASFFLLFALVGSGLGDPFTGTSGMAGSVGPVVILCVLKTALDAWLHAKQHRKSLQSRED